MHSQLLLFVLTKTFYKQQFRNHYYFSSRVPNFRPPPKQDGPQRSAPKPPLPYSGNVGIKPSLTAQPSQAALGGGGGDYDSPWEWKVSKVEQEFEKRFSVGELAKPVAAPRKTPNARGAAPLPPTARGAAPPPPSMHNQNINPLPKPQRTNPPPPQLSLTEKEYEVDPTIPLENQA